MTLLTFELYFLLSNLTHIGQAYLFRDAVCFQEFTQRKNEKYNRTLITGNGFIHQIRTEKSTMQIWVTCNRRFMLKHAFPSNIPGSRTRDCMTPVGE